MSCEMLASVPTNGHAQWRFCILCEVNFENANGRLSYAQF